METKSYEILRRLMYENRIRKADVIRETGVSRPTLLKWEKGQEPSLPVLRKIAKYFGVPVTALIDD